jgi:hypothetical protein
MIHAKRYSASASPRWINCPGSVRLIESLRLPPEPPSMAALEGTLCHNLCEWSVDQGKSPREWLGQTLEIEGHALSVTERHVELAEWAIAKLGDFIQDDSMVFLETRCDYRKAIGAPEGDGYGTSDVVIVNPTETVVVDYKFGMGRVSADSPQLKLYALDEHTPDGDIRLVIIQPKLHAVEEHLTTKAQLHEFANQVRPIVKLIETEDANPPLVPGDQQCQWCPASGHCPALAATVFDIVEKPKAQDTVDLAECLDKIGLVETWAKGIRERAEIELSFDPDCIPGWTLKPGRKGNRSWRNKEEAESVMESARVAKKDRYETKLITPAGAERLLKKGVIGDRVWKRLAEVIQQSEGKPVLAKTTNGETP